MSIITATTRNAAAAMTMRSTIMNIIITMMRTVYAAVVITMMRMAIITITTQMRYSLPGDVRLRESIQRMSWSRS